MKKYSKKEEERMIKFYQSLDESSQRRYASIESARLGHGGKKYIKELLGTSYDRISRGLIELDLLEQVTVDTRIRKKGGGRKGKKTTQK